MSEWIKHDGGEQPVPDGTLIETRFADGSGDTGEAGIWSWVGWDLEYRIVEQPTKGVPAPTVLKDSLRIYCDNFLTLSKAIEQVGGNAAVVLARSHEFLETLARNGIEVHTTVHNV